MRNGFPLTRRVLPSGASCETDSVPIAVLAPGRFSITIVRPWVRLISSANTREKISCALPGGSGTTSLIVPVICDQAPPPISVRAMQRTPAPTAKFRRCGMPMFSPGRQPARNLHEPSQDRKGARMSASANRAGGRIAGPSPGGNRARLRTPSPLPVLEIPQIRRALSLAHRHQLIIGAPEIAFVPDRDHRVGLDAGALGPAVIQLEGVFLVHGPR